MIAIAVIATLVPSAFAGTLSEGTSWAVVLDDLRSMIGLSTKSASPPQVPFLRDYATMLHILMIAALMWLLPRAWVEVEGVLPSLERYGALRWKSPSDRDDAVRRVAVMNGHLASAERVILSVLLAGLMALTGSIGYNRFGIFRVLANPTDPTLWTNQAYNNWWARPFQTASYGWILLAVLGNYLIVWNTRIVLATGLFFWRQRTRPSPWDLIDIIAIASSDGELCSGSLAPI